jgi:photosynthetic reaction center H subunit
MENASITGYIDVAQLVLYGFWIFFAGLIYYLRQEDKREGYPLELGPSERQRRIRIQGFPPIPEPKTFLLPHGGTRNAPRIEPVQQVAAEPVAPWPGAPLQPTGNPMLDAVGPAAYAHRANDPDLTIDGEPKIVPMRVAADFSVDEDDPDPRGMPVVGADGGVAGTVRDIWVDRSEALIRYLEVDVTLGASGRRVLLPMTMARVDVRARRILVASILAEQFADAPHLTNVNQVTLHEEDRICAYYASGHLYAKPSRLGPVL